MFLLAAALIVRFFPDTASRWTVNKWGSDHRGFLLSMPFVFDRSPAS
jgi:hypothetical protein